MNFKSKAFNIPLDVNENNIRDTFKGKKLCSAFEI